MEENISTNEPVGLPIQEKPFLKWPRRFLLSIYLLLWTIWFIAFLVINYVMNKYEGADIIIGIGLLRYFNEVLWFSIVMFIIGLITILLQSLYVKKGWSFASKNRKTLQMISISFLVISILPFVRPSLFKASSETKQTVKNITTTPEQIDEKINNVVKELDFDAYYPLSDYSDPTLGKIVDFSGKLRKERGVAEFGIIYSSGMSALVEEYDFSLYANANYFETKVKEKDCCDKKVETLRSNNVDVLFITDESSTLNYYFVIGKGSAVGSIFTIISYDKDKKISSKEALDVFFQTRKIPAGRPKLTNKERYGFEIVMPDLGKLGTGSRIASFDFIKIADQTPKISSWIYFKEQDKEIGFSVLQLPYEGSTDLPQDLTSLCPRCSSNNFTKKITVGDIKANLYSEATSQHATFVKGEVYVDIYGNLDEKQINKILEAFR